MIHEYFIYKHVGNYGVKFGSGHEVARVKRELPGTLIYQGEFGNVGINALIRQASLLEDYVKAWTIAHSEPDFNHLELSLEAIRDRHG